MAEITSAMENLNVDNETWQRLNIGVTGTRMGMTNAQVYAFQSLFQALIRVYPKQAWHHGDCVGVDAEIHDGLVLWRASKPERNDKVKLIVHPPVDTDLRAFRIGDPDDCGYWKEKTYLERNRDIVDVSALMIVVPQQIDHQGRGGTWYTHDYSVKRGVPRLILFPDGAIRSKINFLTKQDQRKRY